MSNVRECEKSVCTRGRLLVGKTLKSKVTSYEADMKQETVNVVAMKSARTQGGLRPKIAINILYLIPKHFESSYVVKCC